MLEQNQKTLRQKISVLEKEALSRTGGYIVGAFGLVAALAWNDFVHQLFIDFFPASQQNLVAKFSYALASTSIALIVVLLFSRWTKKM